MENQMELYYIAMMYLLFEGTMSVLGTTTPSTYIPISFPAPPRGRPSGTSSGPWDAEHFPNPQVDVQKCGRNGKVSFVCDPDHVLSQNEGKSDIFNISITIKHPS
jgi:hypothetical protein